jgi:hypothetical protein
VAACVHLSQYSVLVARQSALTNKDADWIRRYQFSLNKVIESLGGDEEVSKKYGEMAKLWNGTELPDELKRK